jgi:hypothetical protein
MAMANHKSRVELLEKRMGSDATPRLILAAFRGETVEAACAREGIAAGAPVLLVDTGIYREMQDDWQLGIPA